MPPRGPVGPWPLSSLVDVTGDCGQNRVRCEARHHTGYSYARAEHAAPVGSCRSVGTPGHPAGPGCARASGGGRRLDRAADPACHRRDQPMRSGVRAAARVRWLSDDLGADHSRRQGRTGDLSVYTRRERSRHRPRGRRGPVCPGRRGSRSAHGLFAAQYQTLVDEFKRGRRVRVQLRFWSTWPKTGTHSATFSLIGFTRAHAGLADCRAR